MSNQARDYTAEAHPNQGIIHEYLSAVDTGDLLKVRSMLADQGRFGRAEMTADEYARSECMMLMMKGIHIISEVYDGDGVALLYEGADPTTGQPLEAHEFLTISNGKITSLRGVVVGGVLDGKGAASFSMTSVVMPI